MNILKQALSKIRLSGGTLNLRAELARSRRRVRHLESLQGAPRLPEDYGERFVWIFGGGRSGTTWMANMMRDISHLQVWFEPRVGELFDPYHMRFEQRGGRHFFFSEHHSETWTKNVRDLIFDGARARFPNFGAYDHLMIKEPSGSVGARMLMRTVPESRMILLVRDPRDVAASWIDAMKEGSWSHDRALAKGRRSEIPATSARKRADVYFRNVSESKRAFDEHPGLKTLVHYEDLRADTSSTMKRMFSEVG